MLTFTSEIAALVNKFTRIEQDFKGSKASAVLKGRSIAGEIAGIVKDLEYMIRNIMVSINSHLLPV